MNAGKHLAPGFEIFFQKDCAKCCRFWWEQVHYFDHHEVDDDKPKCRKIDSPRLECVATYKSRV